MNESIQNSIVHILHMYSHRPASLHSAVTPSGPNVGSVSITRQEKQNGGIKKIPHKFAHCPDVLATTQ